MTDIGKDKIRVAIVEDHDIFRKRLKELLGFFDEVELLFTASSGERCLEYLLDDRNIPDVILMDIELPGISGIETTFRLKNEKETQDCEVIMFTVFEDDERIFESIQVGATGYLLKDTPIDDVVQSLNEVKKGGAPISPSIARKMMALVGRTSTTKEEEKNTHSEVVPFQLTPSEINILEHVIEGLSNKEIATELFISPWTVKTHIKNIYKKMQVNSRAAAVRMALKRDITS